MLQPDIPLEDVLGDGGATDAVRCELGTIGWQGEEDLADYGDDGNSGRTYVRVTLAKGSPRGKPVADDGGMNGYRVRCRLQSPCWFIPERGAPCMVLFPGGFAEGSGVALCIPIGGAETGKLPNQKPGEPVLYGPKGQFQRGRQDGSWSRMTTDKGGLPEGNSIYDSVHPTRGWEVVTPWGRAGIGPKGAYMIHSSGAGIRLGGMKAPGVPDAVNSFARLFGATVSVTGKAVTIGTDGGALNEAALQLLATFVDAVSVTILASTDPGMGPTKAAVGTAATAFKGAPGPAVPPAPILNIGRPV